MAPLHSKVSEYCFKDSKTDRRYVSKGSYPDFELKDYCPALLRKILELQNIEYTNYMQSIYGDEHLLHFVASGRFGNVLVSSMNERFVIKILKKSELKVMLEMLPNYYHHLRTYRASLLSKLYGLHALTLFGGVKARIAVMSNELRSCLKVHRCYDLKGTTIGRSTTSMVAENCPVLKDVDFNFCFYLDPIVHLCLLKQIKYDCEFLEAEGIMDYSFLLGIHIEGPHEGYLHYNNPPCFLQSHFSILLNLWCRSFLTEFKKHLISEYHCENESISFYYQSSWIMTRVLNSATKRNEVHCLRSISFLNHIKFCFALCKEHMIDRDTSKFHSKT